MFLNSELKFTSPAALISPPDVSANVLLFNLTPFIPTPIAAPPTDVFTFFRDNLSESIPFSLDCAFILTSSVVEILAFDDAIEPVFRFSGDVVGV